MDQEILEPPHNGRQWAMFCHLAGFLGWIFPLGNIIGPLVLWLMKKKEDPFVNLEGKESLNYQLSYSLYAFIFALVGFSSVAGMLLNSQGSLAIMIFLAIYCILVLALVSSYVIFMIVAAIKAYKGDSFRYPLTIRFIK